MTIANARIETLPGWTYRNDAVFAAEKQHLFLANWQLVCHASEVRAGGDYATLNVMGERAFVVRGDDGVLRAFHNVCRHRAAAVVRGDSGHCAGAIRCFYHGWTYGLDGTLKAVPSEAGFPGLDKSSIALKAIDVETHRGFVYVKFRRGGPSVAERFAPYDAELAQYRFEDMEPYGAAWSADKDVDWKNAADNFLEGYHVPVGHPGLYRLFGARYEVETQASNVSRAVHWLKDAPSSNWSERHYQKLLPELAHLAPERRRAWAYYVLLPNVTFDVYCDHMDYFTIVPTAPGKCRIRGRSFRLPNPSRELRAAQYLSRRINTQVMREDDELILSVQEGLVSESYGAGYLSEKEICVRQLHDMVRAAVPIASLPAAPGA